MSQNGQTHFKNLAANAARILKCVCPVWDIMHYRVKASFQGNICITNDGGVGGFKYSNAEKQLFHLTHLFCNEVHI